MVSSIPPGSIAYRRTSRGKVSVRPGPAVSRPRTGLRTLLRKQAIRSDGAIEMCLRQWVASTPPTPAWTVGAGSRRWTLPKCEIGVRRHEVGGRDCRVPVAVVSTPRID